MGAVYPQLVGEVPGLLGALTARAEAQTIRMALIYALLTAPTRSIACTWRPGSRLGLLRRLDALHLRRHHRDTTADAILRELRTAGNGADRPAARAVWQPP